MSNADASVVTTFAPADVTDGRRAGEWRSRYESEAWHSINREAVYLFLVLFFTATSCLLLWLGIFEHVIHLTGTRAQTFRTYGYAWLGGTLGGVLFSLKWQYHSVAKQLWNYDRRLWRFLTPHISGGLAFASLAVFEAFGSDTLIASRGFRTLAFGFLVGLFSDNALAKLTEIANTLFGTTKSSTHR